MADRLRGDYTVHRRPRRWYMCLFYWAVDTSIVNALILHRLYMSTIPEAAAGRTTTALYFRATLVDQLLSLADTVIATEASSVPRPRRASVPSSTLRHAGGIHLPQHVAHDNHRRMCCYCLEKKGAVYCGACNDYYCLTATRNCFYLGHCVS